MPNRHQMLILIIILIALPIAWVVYKYCYFFWFIGNKSLPSQIGNYQTVRYTGSNNDSQKLTKILFLGDSLTAGVGASTFQNSYPNLFAQELTTQLGNIQTTNHAVPGDKTQNILNRQLSQDLADPQITFVMIGINDMFGHIGTDKFKQNYRQIIATLQQKTNSQIILISIPNITSSSLVSWPLSNYFKWQINNYNQAIAEVAQQYHLPVLDLYSLTENSFSQHPQYYSQDLFHPSDEGYNYWTTNLINAYTNCQSCH